MHRSANDTLARRLSAVSAGAMLLVGLAAGPSLAVCGDGTVDPGEACDDGGFGRGDGCSPRCEVESEPGPEGTACLKNATRTASRLSRSQGLQARTCLQAAAAGAAADVSTCLQGDVRGKVADNAARLEALELGSCAAPPAYGWTPAATTVDRVLEEGRAMAGDLFGDTFPVLVTKQDDPDGARCQANAAAAVQKLADTTFDAFVRCQNTSLKDGGVRSASDLDSCFSAFDEDTSPKVQKASAKLASQVSSSCAALDWPALFGPACAGSSSASSLNGCLKAVARCRSCRAIRATDGLLRPICDAVDDARMNGSCDPAGSPASTLADAARASGIALGATVDVGLSVARRDLVPGNFTSATVENSLKWAELSPAAGSWDFTDADAEVDWIENNGLRVRGHTLFWDRLNGRPSWLQADVNGAPDPAAQLVLRMQEHAAATVGRYAGRIRQWDVVNEPLETTSGNLDPANFYFQVLGEQYLDIAFHAAHDADPTAELFLNEILAEGSISKFNGLVALLEGMIARGVPIHGVGLQGHFFFGSIPYETLVTRIRRLVDLGLRVEFTEVDFPLALFASKPDPLAAQAEAWADLVAACLSVPGCTGVTGWGIDDGDTWLDSFSLTMADAPNRPLLFDASLAPKPAWQSVKSTLEWNAAP